MLRKYVGTVSEVYCKHVTVYASDWEEAEELIGDMEENGEIEWDRADDFSSWEIYDLAEQEDKEYAEKIIKWAKDMVIAARVIDSEWVLKGATENICLNWFEDLKQNGATIPDGADGYDLWNAVQAERSK